MTLNKEQQYIVYGLVLFVVSGAVALTWRRFQEKEHVIQINRSSESRSAIGGRTSRNSSASSPSGIMIQISGAVRKPGVYQFPANARVLDAVRASGGTLPEADLSPLNLVEFLSDGTRLHVPSRLSTPHPGFPASAQISVNLATVEQLDELPGIGKKLAERIVAFRNRHGPLGSLEDLRKVSGVGAKLLKRLKEHLML